MMKLAIKNIYLLGIKELWSLWRDPIMLVLIFYIFTFSVYMSATAMPESLHKASLAVVDEDKSQLSKQIISAFTPPEFLPPKLISLPEIDPAMDAGLYTFVMVIPHGFQRDVLAKNSAEIQLNVDATRMSQAFTGSGYIQQIASLEIDEFVNRYRATASLPVELELRARFNPSLNPSWFGGLAEIISHITLLSIILAGAALLREREQGTLEHLLVMPVTPLQIMLAKIWSMSLVVLFAAFLSINLVVQWVLQIPIAGSLWLFFGSAALLLFATTSLGIFMATLARNMPQFGMLVVLVLLPMQMLSGGMTPYESMPQAVQYIMYLAPTSHFTEIGQAILFRGAGLETIWPNLLALLLIGSALFYWSLLKFKDALSKM